MSIVAVKNLKKDYEYYKKEPGLLGSLKSLIKRKKLSKAALKGISFNIEEGELVGFLGPNGAGKTTALKILSGILYPTSGEAKVLGYIPEKREREYQKQFSIIMGQKNQLWWDLPASESFRLNKEIYEVSDESYAETLDELVELLDIKDILNVQVRKLSLGQRMKCELVAALLHKPKVLFLDEPTIGLDVVAQKNIRDFIKKYNKKEKTTIILTSHYMDDILQLCKRVIIINFGKIIYDGNLDELIKKYAHHKILEIILSGEAQKESLEKFGEVVEFDSGKCVLKIKREKIKEIASSILSSDLPVEDITINEVDVDDVIREIFNDANKDEN